METKTTPLVGERVGGYRIQSYLGHGGMGEVYLAFDERLERPVALKRLHPEVSHDTNRQHMLREARALARLRHPSVVQIHDLIDEGDHQFLVMEYVEGRNLGELLRATGPLPLPLGLSLTRQVAEGLAEAHRHGIIHRDLKAENVMVTAAGEARILDFGLAQMKDRAVSTATFQGKVVGTFRAMSPEQALGRPLDARSDLFSLGVLLYEMLTGTSPFVGENPMDTLRRITQLDPTPATTLRPDLPPDLAGLIDRLLEKDPSFRPADADAVVRDLEGMSKASELAKILADLLGDRESIPQSAGVAEQSTQGGEFTENSFPPLTPSTDPPVAQRTMRFTSRAALAGLIALMVLTMLVWLLVLPAEQTVEPLRVLVLKPEVLEGSPEEVQNAALALYLATLDGLTELKQVVVLEPSSLPLGMKFQDGDAALTSLRSVAGDEILRIQVSGAEGQTALVSLQCLVSDGTPRWSKSFLVTTSLNDLAFLADEIASRLRQAYSERVADAQNVPTLRREDRTTLLQAELRIRRGESQLQPELDVLQDLLARNPTHLETLLVGAKVALVLYADTRNEHFLHTAEQHLQTAHRVAPEDPRPWIDTVNLHLTLHQPSQAAEALTEVQRLNPGAPETLKLSASVLKAQGRVEEALVQLRAAIARRETWQLLYEVADLEYQSGRIEEGRAHFERLQTLVPGNLWVRQQVGKLELLFGDLAQAEAIFLELSRTTPHRSYFTHLGLAAFLQGRFRQAIEAYEAALEFSPEHLIVLLNLADAELARGQVETANALYTRALRRLDELETLGPTESMVRAQCLAHLGDPLQAVETIRQVLRQQPEHPEALYAAAVVYSAVGEHSSALLYISDALEKGYQPRWFGIPVFDSLRGEPNFQRLLAEASAPEP